MSASSDLERDLEAALKGLRGATGKSAQGKENQYGAAYQNLVKAGHRPQLRRKYRAPKG